MNVRSKVGDKGVYHGGGVQSKYLQLSLWIIRVELNTKKPSITVGKGLVEVERSKGWVMAEGLCTPRGRIWLVPNEMRRRVRHCFCSPEPNLWVSSLLLLPMYLEKEKKKVEHKWQHDPLAALNPSSWVIALSAASGLLIHAHCMASLICQSEKVDTFPGSLWLFDQYFSSGGGGREDK